MGVDLTLLPVSHFHVRDGKWDAMCKTQLALGRQSLCWEAIDELKPEKIPEGSDVLAANLTPDGKQLKKDPYGGDYTWVTAERLAAVLERFKPQAGAAAYLRSLPPDTKIILHWH